MYGWMNGEIIFTSMNCKNPQCTLYSAQLRLGLAVNKTLMLEFTQLYSRKLSQISYDYNHPLNLTLHVYSHLGTLPTHNFIFFIFFFFVTVCLYLCYRIRIRFVWLFSVQGKINDAQWCLQAWWKQKFSCSPVGYQNVKVGSPGKNW